MANEASRVPGEYIVQLEKGKGRDLIDNTFGRYGITAVEMIGDGLYRIVVRDDPGEEAMRQAASGTVGIKFIQPNNIRRLNPPGKEIRRSPHSSFMLFQMYQLGLTQIQNPACTFWPHQLVPLQNPHS